jgi:hypothetical protein
MVKIIDAKGIKKIIINKSKISLPLIFFLGCGPRPI